MAAWKFRRGILWSAELKNLNSRLLTTPLPVEFGQIDKDSLDPLLTAVHQMDPISSGALVKRFELGRQCFSAQIQGDVAAYGWVTRGSEYVGEFERQLQVQEGEAYVWDCSTLPVYRHQRLFVTLLSYICDQLRREGLQRLWIIGIDAAPAINRGVAAAGFEPVMRLSYLRLIGMHVMRLNPYKQASAQLHNDARRLLTGEGEWTFGPLLVGTSRPERSPATHFDRPSSE